MLDSHFASSYLHVAVFFGEFLPTHLAECRKRRLNQGSFVLQYFVLFAFSGFVDCIFTARCYAERGIAMASCLSVRLSVHNVEVL